MRTWFEKLAHLRQDADVAALILRTGSAVVTIGAILLVTSVVHSTFYDRTPNDFSIYLEAAKALQDGRNIYDVTTPVLSFGLGELPLRYLYPPFLAGVLCVLLPFGTAVINSLWIALGVLSIVVVAWTMRVGKLVTSLGIGWIVGCFTFWPPTLDCLEAGQVNHVVLALLAIFWIALQRGRFAVAGWSLGTAIMLKVTPVFLAFLLLSREAAPARKHLAVSLTVLSILMLVAFGSSVWVDFFVALPRISSGAEVWMNRTNLALGRFLFDSLPGISRDEALLLQRIPVVLGCYLSSYRAWQWGRAGLDRCLSAMLLVMVLAAPVIWYNHLVWCALPILTAWAVTRGALVSRVTVLLCALGITSSRFVDMYLQRHGAFEGGPGAAILCCSAVTLVVILCRQHSRSLSAGLCTGATALS